MIKLIKFYEKAVNFANGNSFVATNLLRNACNSDLEPESSDSVPLWSLLGGKSRP